MSSYPFRAVTSFNVPRFRRQDVPRPVEEEHHVIIIVVLYRSQVPYVQVLVVFTPVVVEGPFRGVVFALHSG